jgi:hypothetical protein
MGMASDSPKCFTGEGVEQMKKAVRERNSAGDMTQLKLKIPELLYMPPFPHT